jgi:hypothetical protein
VAHVQLSMGSSMTSRPRQTHTPLVARRLPTPVQVEAIPLILGGGDVMAVRVWGGGGGGGSNGLAGWLESWALHNTLTATCRLTAVSCRCFCGAPPPTQAAETGSGKTGVS